MATRRYRKLITTFFPQRSAPTTPMVGTILCAIFTVAAAVISLKQSHAHPIDMAVVSITLNERGGDGSLSLRPLANSTELPAHPRDGSRALATMVLGDFTFEQTLSRCAPHITREGVTGANIRVHFELRCPASASDGPLLIQRDPRQLADFPPEFTTVFIVSREGKSFSTTMRRDDSRCRIDFPAHRGLVESLALGMAHIGATPSEWIRSGKLHIPEGIDHILFVMTLVLVSPSFFSLLKTITGFTVGHSISLAYMTLRGHAIEPALVEPAIAFSIAVMAFIAIRQNSHSSTTSPWILSALFGALHGCGFASALLESAMVRGSIVVTLLGFNIGVEVGQLIVVLLFLAALSTAGRNQTRRHTIVVALGSAILCVSLFWTFERLANSF